MFKDFIIARAEEESGRIHPLVEELQEKQMIRMAYWLVFALYAKVEDQCLSTELQRLGKSLKLDNVDIEIKQKLVANCASEATV